MINKCDDILGKWDNSWKVLTSLIVDMHGFSKMVAHDRSIAMAQFIRDIFVGSVIKTEENGGVVVNTMGDAVLCLFKSPEQALLASMGIVRDFWKSHEYLVGADKLKSKDWQFIERGVFCRCAFETGTISKDELTVKQGQFIVYVGEPINYAQRIIHFPEKAYSKAVHKRNTIIVGPRSQNILSDYSFEKPIIKKVKGTEYIGYTFDTEDLWGD